MTLLPVIARELRTSARHPFTYYLRGLGAGALLVASGLFGLQHSFGPTLGGLLFGNLHFTLFWAIWILVPLLTVDCLSRERREGTLGLLFLTRLHASDIVAAKGLVHGLRALTLWLAVLPVAAIPMLLGGVSWKEAAASVCVNFSSIFLALGAGLLASSLSKTWPRAMTLAVMLCFVVGSVFVIFHCFSFVIMIVAFGLGGRGGIGWPTLDQFMQTAFMLVLRSHDFWSQGVGSLPPRAQSGWRLPTPCDQKSCERKTSMNAVCMNWSRVGHPIPPRPPSPKATIMITKEKQWKMTNTDPTTKQSITANVIARGQVLERDEASRPAPNARKIELKFTHTDAAASFQLTPPKSIGMAATGSTASHNVRARKPWTSPLAATMSLACSRVRKSSPRVPSRRSRLRQSTVSSGTKIQIAQKSVKWRLPKSRPPRVGPKLCWRPKRPLATSKAPAPRPRK